MIAMKGPNPFAEIRNSLEAISGRKDESRIFNGLLSATSAGQSGMIIVRGGSGSGKSALLSAFRDAAEAGGVLAPYTKAERNEGMGSVLGKIFQDALMLSGSPAKGTPIDAAALESSLRRMAQKRHFGTIVFIDDMDLVRKPEAELDSIAKTLGHGNVSFVVSSTREFRITLPESVKMVELGPLAEHDFAEMVEKALKKGPPKMGEECLRSILADTGGNPRLLKTVCRIVYERLRDNEKVISKGHYLAYLPYIMSVLSREWFGRIYQETPEGERMILGVLAPEDEGVHVSDISKKLKKPLGPTTALMKRLLDSGQVVRLGRGKYRIFARLYGKYVAQRG